MDYVFTEADTSTIRPPPPSNIFDDSEVWGPVRVEPARGGALEKPKHKFHPWFYNHVHDMESVVWLFFYVLLHCDVYLSPILPRTSHDHGTPSALRIEALKAKSVI